MMNKEPFVVLDISGFVNCYGAQDWHTCGTHLTWQPMSLMDNALSI
jgi:hypothetical protein